MDRMEVVTPELLRKLIRFDECSGKYFWKHRPLDMFKKHWHQKAWNTRNAGQELFLHSKRDGYPRLGVLGYSFIAHRVIWAFHYGEWPKETIDHINGVRDDNRIENLRQCTIAENHKNKGMLKSNTSGRCGVTWEKVPQKWAASISVNNRTVHLGTFLKFEDAVLAREAGEQKYGFHQNHGKERPRYARTSR